MHILTLEKRFAISEKEVFEPGQYLAEDVNAAWFMYMTDGGQMTPLVEKRPFDEMQDWNGKRILFERMGGFGDLILLTPVLQEIKRRWPDAIINVSTMRKMSEVLKNLHFISNVVQYPIPYAEAQTYDAWVFLENAVEKNEIAKELHMTDLFAEITGLIGDYDKKPVYNPTFEEIVWCMEKYPRNTGKRRACVQVGCGNHARLYPLDMLSAVVKKLAGRGWEVFLLGAPKEINIREEDNITNLAQARLTMRQSAVVINNSDVVLGNDSAILHLAGALGIPAVGLFGAFPWQLRTAYCPTTHAIQGTGACSPCFFHARLNQQLPADGPCQKSGYCDVLATIEPSRIVTKMEQIAKPRFDLVSS